MPESAEPAAPSAAPAASAPAVATGAAPSKPAAPAAAATKEGAQPAAAAETSSLKPSVSSEHVDGVAYAREYLVELGKANAKTGGNLISSLAVGTTLGALRACPSQPDRGARGWAGSV